MRKVFYENRWISTAEDEWKEITKATFSHDKAGREDRFMDLKFFLSQGGYVEAFTKFAEAFELPASGRSLAEMKLPPLP